MESFRYANTWPLAIELAHSGRPARSSRWCAREADLSRGAGPTPRCCHPPRAVVVADTGPGPATVQQVGAVRRTVEPSLHRRPRLRVARGEVLPHRSIETGRCRPRGGCGTVRPGVGEVPPRCHVGRVGIRGGAEFRVRGQGRAAGVGAHGVGDGQDLGRLGGSAAAGSGIGAGSGAGSWLGVGSGSGVGSCVGVGWGSWDAADAVVARSGAGSVRAGSRSGFSTGSGARATGASTVTGVMSIAGFSGERCWTGGWWPGACSIGSGRGRETCATTETSATTPSGRGVCRSVVAYCSPTAGGCRATEVCSTPPDAGPLSVAASSATMAETAGRRSRRRSATGPSRTAAIRGAPDYAYGPGRTWPQEGP